MNRLKVKTNSLVGIMTHVLVLTIVFILPEVIFTAAMDRRDGSNHYDVYLHTLIYIITFYINYFILIDRYLFKKKVAKYFIITLIFIAVMAIIGTKAHIVTDFLSGNTPPPPKVRYHHGHDFFFFSLMTRDYVMLVLTVGLSIALKMGLRFGAIEKLNERITAQQKDMELKTLKSQLNPHFLFNTLNNIYALTAINAEKAQNAIHQLSKLLRYALYENDEKEVSIDKEFLFMKSYIDLMALRLGSNTKLELHFPEIGSYNLTIAPMMFISLIENAFKHGVSATKPSFIKINISIDGTTIRCNVENSCFPKEQSDKSGSGIGLTNLRRQLRLLYENRYEFTTEIVNDTYIANLIINLSNHQ